MNEKQFQIFINELHRLQVQAQEEKEKHPEHMQFYAGMETAYKNIAVMIDNYILRIK